MHDDNQDNIILNRLKKGFEEKSSKYYEISQKSFILKKENNKSSLLNSLVKEIDNQKPDLKKIKNLSVFEKEYWFFYLSKNFELISKLLLEVNAYFILHPFNTIKTRIQSKHPNEDVSYFVKNKVADQCKKKKYLLFFINLNQALYKGFNYGIASLLIGNITNFIVYKYMSLKKLSNLKSEVATNMLIFSCADIISAPLRIPFDIKKQFLQMNDKEKSFKRTLAVYRRVLCKF